jgi:nitrite reductase/ring-hydroxylating ferredoxin subunit
VQVTVVDDGLVAVGRSTDIAELGRLVVDVGDRTIGIFRVGGRLYAYDNVCAHQGGPVCQGKIMPKVCESIDAHHRAHGMIYDRTEMHIVCPWHGTEFVITTGCHATASDIRLTAVDVCEHEGEIYVRP